MTAPTLAPSLVPCLAPGGGHVRSPPRCSSQAVGELDSLTGLLCGCGDVGGCGAAGAAGCGRRRLWSPGPGPGAEAVEEVTVLPRPVPDPWGRVTAGALPYLPGAAQTVSGSGEPRDLPVLSGVAWFPPPPPALPRDLRERGGLHESSKGARACSGMGWVAAAEWEAYIFSWELGLRRRVYHISPGSRSGPRSWQGCVRGSGGWVSSSDPRRDLI